MSARYYMGGVCGMGMAPLAAFLADEGNAVDGFDDSPNPELRGRLENLGVKFRPPSGRYDRVVISTALWRRRGEFAEFCGAKGVARRGECWAELCVPRKLTAVVGSHGKSTVSALLAHAINRLSLDCGYLVGAIPNGFAMHGYCAAGKPIVSEIDESDATIEYFSPEVAVALNADLDHTDTYADDRKLGEMFERLFSRTRRLVIYPEGDKILERAAARVQTPSVPVKLSGDYFEKNSAMALAALRATFPDGSFAPSAFEGFEGLQRRSEKIFDDGKVCAVSDYAHHPNEVGAFLRSFLPQSEVETDVFFQPHRYTRTRRFAADFAKILSEAESVGARVFILPVYAASEIPDPLGESSEIIKKAPAGSRIKLAEPDDFFKIAKAALEGGKPRRIALVGAGDFHFAAKKFFAQIK